MRRALLAVALAGAFAAPTGAATCQEDAPCWNWRTMGNHTRGVKTVAGRSLVVGPAKFDALNRNRRIDWRSTPRLKGDKT